MEHNIRVNWIGRREGLPEVAVRGLDETVAYSAANTGLCVCLAINYGGRAELVDAARALPRRPLRRTRSGGHRRGRAGLAALHPRHARARPADPDGRAKCA